jgi:hypothetical protein
VQNGRSAARFPLWISVESPLSYFDCDRVSGNEQDLREANMRLISLAVLLALALPASAAMYKWVDAQGRVQYSDIPPPPGTKVEEQKIMRNTIATAGTPFAIQEAAKRNPVTLWMHDCGELCNRARDFLANRGIPYTLRNPSRMNEQDAWRKASAGENAVPLLVVGTRSLKGFEEPEWNATLDAAGYPRGACALVRLHRDRIRRRSPCALPRPARARR